MKRFFIAIRHLSHPHNPLSSFLLNYIITIIIILLQMVYSLSPFLIFLIFFYKLASAIVPLVAPLRKTANAKPNENKKSRTKYLTTTIN